MEKLTDKELTKLKNDIDDIYSSVDFKEIDDEGSILYLLCGIDGDDKDFYSYMAIKPSLFRNFLEKQVLEENFIPTDYGIVLESGFGQLPPKDVQEYVKDKYGFNHKYQDKIEALL